jgi:ABC-type transporter Mla subunit MlaD
MAFAAAIGTLALVAAGCGGDDESSAGSTTGSAPAEWADGFCTAVSAWTDELQTIGSSIDDPSSLNEDALRQAADDLGAATDNFVEDVRGLGAPDTESGQAVQDSLDTLADTLDTEKADIETAVDDASGITGLATAISAIGTSLTAMGTAFQNTLQAIEDADASGELETALKDSSACDTITS